MVRAPRKNKNLFFLKNKIREKLVMRASQPERNNRKSFSRKPMKWVMRAGLFRF